MNKLLVMWICYFNGALTALLQFPEIYYRAHKHNFSAKPVCFFWDWLHIRNKVHSAASITIAGVFVSCFRGFELGTIICVTRYPSEKCSRLLYRLCNYIGNTWTTIPCVECRIFEHLHEASTR